MDGPFNHSLLWWGCLEKVQKSIHHEHNTAIIAHRVPTILACTKCYFALWSSEYSTLFSDRKYTKTMIFYFFFFLLPIATFGNPNAGGGINNGVSPIKLEAAHNAAAASGSNYYTCATYGSPSPGANEHHTQQSLLATSAYSKYL